jgi:hypothetical protein
MWNWVKGLFASAASGATTTASAVSAAGTVRFVLIALACALLLGGCCGGCACATVHRWTN